MSNIFSEYEFLEVILLKYIGKKKMQSIYDNKINGEALYSINKEETFEFPKRLKDKNYAIPFKVLINYYLVRTFAINRYKLISDYIHLLEQEQFDEH